MNTDNIKIWYGVLGKPADSPKQKFEQLKQDSQRYTTDPVYVLEKTIKHGLEQSVLMGEYMGFSNWFWIQLMGEYLKDNVHTP